MKYNTKYSLIFIFATSIILAAIPDDAFAAKGVLGNLDLQGMITNLQTLLAPFTKLTLAISFVSGIGFMFHGVAMLHTFGQLQHQMSKPQGVTGPFIYIGIGAALMYLPSTITTVSNTFFGTSITNFLNPADTLTFDTGTDGTITVHNMPNYETQGASKLMSYIDVGGIDEWAQLINVLVQFIQLVGLIAFVRGWFILSHAGGAGAQQGSFSKGLIHIIGGILSINFIPFMHAIAEILF